MKFTGRLAKKDDEHRDFESEFFYSDNPYEFLYENLAQTLPPENSIGGGDFVVIGEILLSVLADAGMKPKNSLFDLGCGTGRLSIQAIKYLESGKYFGCDISETMLLHARKLTSSLQKDSKFIHLNSPNFENLPVFDFICAFSVFTHMEPEDSYSYIKALKTISHSKTKLVLSIIPIESDLGHQIFKNASELTLAKRWQDVRNVATSIGYFEELSKLAGWRLIATYDGESESIPMIDSAILGQLGQTVLVLEQSP